MGFPLRTAASVGIAFGLAGLASVAALGQIQAPPATGPGLAPIRVETAPLELTPPERFLVPIVVEPGRRVELVPLVDGVVAVVQGQVGSAVRERQEVAQLDRAEASALLKVAQAELKERQAEAKAARASNQGDAAVEQASARIEAAQARVDLAQLAVDRCTLRAPFAGRLLEVRATPGQFVERGRPVAVLADTTALRALVPVGRGTEPGSTLTLAVEESPVEAKVQSVIPLPDAFEPLRALHAPLSAAWVELPNPAGDLEPGQRLRSPVLPDAPLAIVPTQALRQAQAPPPAPGGPRGARPSARSAAAPPPVASAEPGKEQLQVLRNERVVDVPVRVLGAAGPERVQVSGAFRQGDALIVWASTPLVAGALVRFPGQGASPGVEAYAPPANQPGAPAQVASPAGAPAAGSAPAVVPPVAQPKAAPKATTAPPVVPF